jgi:integrative and conjugative element protein (TIGR02256 family)
MQCNVVPATQAWLAEEAVRAMVAEASTQAPHETGGVLLGYWGKESGEAVVTNIVGPGPDATHSATRFVPDYEFQENEIARLYEESHRRLEYLGDWHSHPEGGGKLSKLDRRTLRTIGWSRPARVEHPIMVVIAGGPEWSLHAWQHDWVGWWHLRWPTTHQLIVKVFELET